MNTRPNYQPLERVILFNYEHSRDGGPVVAWVTSTAIHRNYILRDEQGRWLVRISGYESDAHRGAGSGHRADRMRPYSDEFWAHVEEWRRRGKQLQADLAQLARGKVPVDYQQAGLFEAVSG
jgi:hypothetical protein